MEERKGLQRRVEEKARVGRGMRERGRKGRKEEK